MEHRKTAIDRLASGLGWFSIGLGLTELLAPRRVSEAIGIKSQPGWMRLLGAREVAAGIGILTERKRAGWLWARVAGDAMDMAYLAAAQKTDSKVNNFAGACAAVAGAAALDVYCSIQLGQETPVHVIRAITIERPAEELFAYWREFERLPTFMRHLHSVERTGDNRWRWVAKAPAGRTVEWEAEIINEIPNELIAWRSLEGADVENAGTVRFEPATGGRGTVVKVDILYRPPAGVAGAKVAKIFGESPEQQIAVELRRFKQLMETGEIARTEGQPVGQSRNISKIDELVRT